MQHLHCKDGIAPGNVVPAGLIPSQEGRGELRRTALLAGDAGFPEAEARRLRRAPRTFAGHADNERPARVGHRLGPHADPACGGR
jgi:hypothetical protein